MEVTHWLRAQWDRALASVAIGAGALALLLGWIGVSGAAFPAQQIPYVISGGLVGLFLLGIGGMLWLSADLRDEWRKLDDLDRHVTELAARTEVAPTPTRNGTRPKRTKPTVDKTPVDVT